MKKLTLAFITTLALATTAYATPENDTYYRVCFVDDPTDTPLKYRSSPYGKVLGTLANGTKVYYEDSAEGIKEDKKGGTWVKTFNYRTNKYLGWTFANYLSCTHYK